MTRKPTDGNNEEPAETSPSIINGQRILTPELSSFLTSVNELAIKNFDMLKTGKEQGMGVSLDWIPELGN